MTRHDERFGAGRGFNALAFGAVTTTTTAISSMPLHQIATAQ